MKKFLATTGYVLLTLLAVISVVWMARVPLAVKICGAVRRNVSPDECIKTVAVKLGNTAMCERITGADFEYENPPKMQCLSDIAKVTNDIELCARVNEGGFISETEFTCLYRIAYEHKNAAACAALVGSESRLGISRDKATCFAAIGKTEADVASAPPKKDVPPIFLGMGAGALSAVAYVILGLWTLWTLWTIVKIAMKAKKKA